MSERFIVQETPKFRRPGLEVIDTVHVRVVQRFDGKEPPQRTAAQRLADHKNERAKSWPAKLEQLLGRLREAGDAGVGSQTLWYESGGELEDLLREAAAGGYKIESRSRGFLMRYVLLREPAGLRGAVDESGLRPGDQGPADTPEPTGKPTAVGAGDDFGGRVGTDRDGTPAEVDASLGNGAAGDVPAVADVDHGEDSTSPAGAHSDDDPAGAGGLTPPCPGGASPNGESPC